MEVPLAWFVSPVSLEDTPRPKMVLAALGRPLFISWSPDGSTIVHVSFNRFYKCSKTCCWCGLQASACSCVDGNMLHGMAVYMI